MTDLLDFLYIDLKRLESFASQLFGGVPDSTTQESGRDVELDAGVKGGLPFLLQGSADSRAVFSASSTVTSRMHHYLVSRVLEELRSRQLLLSDARTATDGSFVRLQGRLQIVDPYGLASILRMLSPMLQTLSRLQPEQSDASVASGRRSAVQRQRREQQQAVALQARQFEAFADVTEAFGRETVRVRVLEGTDSNATAVAERDKFVERLDRLVLRHGYLTGGEWHVLAQVNTAGGQDFYEPEGSSFLDLLERTGVAALQQLANVSAGDEAEWTLTPLAIYRAILGAA